MTVTNNRDLNQFEVLINGGLGFLRYRMDANTMLLLHVEVPSNSRGQGIAGELSRAALDFARERAYKVVPICSYLAAYIRRNPEYSALVR
jgi:predicted GNAT family acetyltransferase